MSVIEVLKTAWEYVRGPSQEEYELDDEWEELLKELRDEVHENGFDLEDNEGLTISILAHVVRENKKGLEMLAEEEVAEKSRMGEDKEIDESKGVTIQTIDPVSD